MRIGNLRTKEEVVDGKTAFVIQGRKKGTNLWDNCYDPEREKRGLDKWLRFDLEYDACGILVSFAQWFKEINHSQAKAINNDPVLKAKLEKRIKDKHKNRIRNKAAKRSKQKNRNKK